MKVQLLWVYNYDQSYVDSVHDSVESAEQRKSAIKKKHGVNNLGIAEHEVVTL